MKNLYIDFETYSSVDLKSCGAYPYVESENFEPLMVAYSIDDESVFVEDLIFTKGKFPEKLIKALQNKNVLIHAHNASFERLVLKAVGYNIPVNRFRCSAVKASYCGLPIHLDGASKALDLGVEKSAKGRALIKYFCMPCKPTKANDFKTKNLREDDLDKWADFLEYCRKDVIVEKALLNELEAYDLPESEQRYYEVDQIINDRGIKVDLAFINKAIEIDEKLSDSLYAELKNKTGLDNPNSPLQLAKWLSCKLDKNVNSVARAILIKLGEDTENAAVREVIDLKLKSAKTSVKKYIKAKNYACKDGRVRGLHQFYGGGRTGRWAGRGVQIQNLPRNYLEHLTLAREAVKTSTAEVFSILYDTPKDILSQLVRTMFIPSSFNSLLVVDYSAIEARVIAWLADEKWRLDVFNTHGKIYEASASLMFGIPIENISKTSDIRFKGKVAELALGYQGGEGALLKMGGDKMGLSKQEMKDIVVAWRLKNPAIKNFWKRLENSALRAVRNPNQMISMPYFNFIYDELFLQIILPSGRSLFYKEPVASEQIRYGKTRPKLIYKSAIQKAGRWGWVDTYGGKIAENVAQAVARDVLAEALYNLTKAEFKIVLHVHDEIGIDTPTKDLDAKYAKILEIMCKKPIWAKGLPIGADGFISAYYKKG